MAPHRGVPRRGRAVTGRRRRSAARPRAPCRRAGASRRGGARGRARTGWVVPDLPGHGTTPAPRHGAYDPLGPVTLARWALGGRGPGGRRRPERPRRARSWRPAAAATRWPSSTACGVRGRTRTTPSTDDVRRPPSDPRRRRRRSPRRRRPASTRGRGTATACTCPPAFAQRFWGAITCPVLAVETPASPTPPSERAERVDLVRRPDDARRAARSPTEAVVDRRDRRVAPSRDLTGPAGSPRGER